MAIKVVIITVIVFWKVIIMYLKMNEAPRTATLLPLVSLITGKPIDWKPHKTKQPSDSSGSCSRGAMWGSNPRHPEPQSGALPTELIAPCWTTKVVKKID